MAGYIGSRSVALSTTAANVEDITATDTSPEVTLVNTTHEDTDGGREGKVIFKGQQSGGEESTLAEIQASHDGASDDEKGDLIFRTNDGSDGNSPTEAVRIDSAGVTKISSTIANAPQFVVGGTTGGGNRGIALVDDNGAKYNFFIGAQNNVNNAFEITPSTAAGGTTYSNPALVIDSDGSVGIGVTPTTSWDLQLATATSSSRFRMQNSTTGTSDGDGGSIAMEGNDFVLQNSEVGTFKVEMGGVERMRLNTAGGILLGMTNTNPAGNNVNGFAVSGYGDGDHGRISAQASGDFHRLGRSGDGTIIGIYSAGGLEGGISISGTTTSYNGGHLARWSRLTNGNKDSSIVKGTVLTNLDEMVVWSHEAVAATYYEEGDELPENVSVGDEKTPAVDTYTEDNEQLNCMAVSSVEGDPNVAGVFVHWDDDDDFNDMNVAMTGDMVIRIAQGTTVARGDLLMSAGDGTAKPQDDDIVRSKTIAKVTSTNVSHTYDDGSYLVPCVLMAC